VILANLLGSVSLCVTEAVVGLSALRLAISQGAQSPRFRLVPVARSAAGSWQDVCTRVTISQQ